MLNVEIWRTIADFPSYEVSSKGRVRSLRTLRDGKYLVLKTFTNNSGYVCVSFSRGDGGSDKRLVHRLVAEAFCPKSPGLDVVNHKNGIKTGNTPENLEWTTQASNLAHARITGLKAYNKPTLGIKLPARSLGNKASSYLGVCWVESRKRWLGQVVFDNKRYGSRRFKSALEAAEYRDSIVIANKLPLPLNFN